MAGAIYLSNDNLLEIDGLKNTATDAYINNATVTATLVDEGGTAVVGETWPITLSYVSGSDGKYRGTLKDTLSLTAGLGYTAQITADGGADLKGYWEFPLRSAVRT